MPEPKKKPGRPRKQPVSADGEKIAEKMTEPVFYNPGVATLGVVYANHPMWVYHNDEEPRLLKPGDIIPNGWTSDIRTLSVGWRNDFYGKWIREPK